MNAVLWAAATLEGKGLQYVSVEFPDKGMIVFVMSLLSNLSCLLQTGLLFYLNKMHTLQYFFKIRDI